MTRFTRDIETDSYRGARNGLPVALVITALASAMVLASIGQASAVCAVGGTTLTCSGVTLGQTIENFGGGGVDTVVVDPGADLDSSGVNLSALTLNSAGDGDLAVTLGTGATITTTTGNNTFNRGIEVFQVGATGDLSFVNNGATINTTAGFQNVATIFQSQDSFGEIRMTMNDGLVISGSPANGSSNAHGMMIHKLGGTGDGYLNMTGGEIRLNSSAFLIGLYSYRRNSAVGDGIIEMSGGRILGTNISGNNFGAYGIYNRLDSGSVGNTVVNFSGGEIIGMGTNSLGIFSPHGGLGTTTVNMTGGSIITDGDGGRGIANDHNNGSGTYGGDAITNFSGGTIETRGIDSPGIRTRAQFTNVESNVFINQTGGSIVTRGDDSYGLLGQRIEFTGAAFMSDGDIFVDQSAGTIETFGTDSYGIYALTQTVSGSATVTFGGQITTHGANAHGIVVQTNDPFSFGPNPGMLTINATGGTINTTGDGAAGLAAFHEGSGAINITSAADITASGNNSIGIFAFALNANVADISVTGGTVMGGRGAGSAGITALSTSVTTIDIASGAYVGALSDRAIVGLNTPTTITNAGTLTGYVTLADDNDNFTNSSSNSWNIRNFQATTNPATRDTENVALSDFGGGDDSFTNTSTGTVRLLTIEDMTNFTPDTTDDTAPTAWLTSGVAEYSPSVSGQARINRSIRQSGVEQAQLVNLERFENAGLITMADAETGGTGPVAGDVFVITGNSVANGVSGGGVYVSNGGALHIDTVLNDGRKDDTDLLVVDRAERGSGATAITVTNAQVGRGASTDTNGNGRFNKTEGILVVQSLESGSQASAFELAGPVIAGAWQYELDQTDGQNWYLHSQLSAATPVLEEFSQYLLFGLVGGNVPTMQQRIGNRYWSAAGASCEARSAGYPNGMSEWAGGGTDFCAEEADPVWLRMEGSHEHLQPTVSTTDSSYDLDQWRLQGGADGLFYKDAAGNSFFGGVTAHYGTASSDVMSSFGDGSIDTQAYGAGVTATGLGADGGYVDLQGTYSWFDSDLASDGLGAVVDDNHADGYALSVELGKKLPWQSDWTVTPQAQLHYASVNFDSFTGSFGEAVSLDEADSLRLRLGAALDQDRVWIDASGSTQRSHYYVVANVIHEFDGKTVVDVSGTKLIQKPNEWFGEVGLGLTRNFDNDKYAFYGEVNASTNLDNEGSASFGDSYRFYGTAGLKVAF